MAIRENPPTYIYNNNLYQYKNNQIQIKSIDQPIIKHITSIAHISTFTLGQYSGRVCIFMIETYYKSSDHYFDTMANKLVIIDIDTLLPIYTLQLPDLADKYITKMHYENNKLIMYQMDGQTVIDLDRSH